MFYLWTMDRKAKKISGEILLSTHLREDKCWILGEILNNSWFCHLEQPLIQEITLNK